MKQNPFMMIVRIKKGQEDILENELRKMGNDVNNKKSLASVHLDFDTKSPSTHFARFIVL